jgi:phytoene desaturase
MVGASTHPGAGIPGVLTSAKLLDKVIPDVPQRKQLADKKVEEGIYGNI